MKLTKRVLLCSVIIICILNASCGTLLYPERQGQKGGKIDPSLAIMNGIGLLLFIIPGLVAFGVDFHTGAIYLPNSRSDVDTNKTKEELNYRQIGKLETFDKEELETIIAAHTGIESVLNNPKIQITKTNVENFNTYTALYSKRVSH